MSAQPPDNYDAFLSRLDAATSSLNARAAAVDKGLVAVSLLVGPFESGVQSWADRRRYVSGQLAAHAGSPQRYTALSELHDVAVKMEAMFRGRLRHVQEKLAAMQDRREAIHRSLLELELSRKKLESSRLLSQDREKLGTIFSSLAGSAVAVSALPDTGLLGDLREAREAIILAEALMELKGY